MEKNSITNLSVMALEDYIRNSDEMELEELENFLTNAEKNFCNGIPNDLTEEEYNRIVRAYKKIIGDKRKKYIFITKDPEILPTHKETLSIMGWEDYIRNLDKMDLEELERFLSTGEEGYYDGEYFAGEEYNKIVRAYKKIKGE